MNQREFDLLSDTELPPLAVTLYVRCFRKNMDFATGSVFVSYRRMAQDMEHTPPRGSTKPITRPSRAELRHAIDQLKRGGLIALYAKGSLAHNKAAEYRCVIASDFSRVREEQPESNTGTTIGENPPQAPKNKGVRGNVVNLRKSEEQHKPEQPLDDDVYARANFEFGDVWAAEAKKMGFSGSENEINALFNVWRESEAPHIYRSKSAHIQKWRKYCASTLLNQLKQGGGHAKRNATTGKYEAAYEASRAAVERCVEQGIDFDVF